MSRFSKRFNPLALITPSLITECRASARLALPIVGAQLAQSTNGVIDTITMGQLGQIELAAGGLASTTFATLLVTATGVLMAVSPLVAEARGQGNLSKVRQTTTQGFFLALLLLIPLVISLSNTEFLMLNLGQSERTATLSASYLQVMRWAVLPALLLTVLRESISALSDTKPIFIVGLVGTLFNTVGNYTLGLGNWGLPRMELPGIAMTSCLSYAGMLLALVIYILQNKQLREYRLLDRWYHFRPKPFIRLVWLGIPIGLSAALEIGLYAMTAYLMGTFSTEALAAYQIVIQVIVMLFMVPVGIGHAATVRIGVWHGQRDRKGVKRAATVGIVLGALFMGLTAFLLLIFPRTVISFFLDLDSADSISVVSIATTMLAISTCSQFFDGIQTAASGALRGLQDTRIPMLLSFTAFWITGLTVGYTFGFVLEFGSIGLWVGQSVGVFVAAVSFLWRLRWTIRTLPY